MMQLERLIEEEAVLVEEMKQHWTHLTTTCRALKDQASVLSDDLATQSTNFLILFTSYSYIKLLYR